MSSRSRRPRTSSSSSASSSMEINSGRRSVKVVRVLCDGCERASASVYCTECNESACHSCAEQLHVRGRRVERRQKSRTCQGRAMKDLQKTVGVLALCTSCRVRPAHVSFHHFSLSTNSSSSFYIYINIFSNMFQTTFESISISYRGLIMVKFMVCVKNVDILINRHQLFLLMI